MQAIASICIWTRFLFYLRSIERMSYLVRLIAETVVDKTFLSFAIVLAVCVFGFADAFLSVREAVAVDRAEKAAEIVQAATIAAALWAK